MSESAVMEQPTTAAPAKERKELTPEQKQAATLRRDAALLEKYGNTAKANELKAQADALAPASAKAGRVDPMTKFSNTDIDALKNSFRTKEGFARLCKYVSYKQLAKVLTELSA